MLVATVDRKGVVDLRRWCSEPVLSRVVVLLFLVVVVAGVLDDTTLPDVCDRLASPVPPIGLVDGRMVMRANGLLVSISGPPMASCTKASDAVFSKSQPPPSQLSRLVLVTVTASTCGCGGGTACWFGGVLLVQLPRYGVVGRLRRVFSLLVLLGEPFFLFDFDRRKGVVGLSLPVVVVAILSMLSSVLLPLPPRSRFRKGVMVRRLLLLFVGEDDAVASCWFLLFS